MTDANILHTLQTMVAAMVPAAITLPIAILASGGLIMYWQSLRDDSPQASRSVAAATRSDNPPSRRRIRRANCLIQLFLVAMLVNALSVVDALHQPASALLAWTSVTLLLLLTITLALVDVYNTWRLHRRTRDRLRSKARGRLQSQNPDKNPHRNPSSQ